jgi:multiple antibiotic resistance protein
MTIFSAALLLFLVMDPLGNIPMYLTALKNVPNERRTKVIMRELLIALAIMIIFLFAGQHFLSALKISGPALTTTGGVVLFLISIKMIFPPQGGSGAINNDEEPFIVPLAIPYLAGPSTIATLILIMNNEPQRWLEWLGALVGAWFVCGIILISATPLAKILRNRGLIAIERLMGMILVALAIQMLMNGIGEFVHTL